MVSTNAYSSWLLRWHWDMVALHASEINPILKDKATIGNTWPQQHTTKCKMRDKTIRKCWKFSYAGNQLIAPLEPINHQMCGAYEAFCVKLLTLMQVVA